jgi:hypothetical protein
VDDYQYDNESSLSMQDDARQNDGLGRADESESEEEDSNVSEDIPPGPPNLAAPPRLPNLPEPPGPPHSPGPPNPPVPPPSRRHRRTPEVKLIKLTDSYSFKGKPGDDFYFWWIILQTFLQDQLEKFDNSGRTITWTGGFLKKYTAAPHVPWVRQALAGILPRS